MNRIRVKALVCGTLLAALMAGCGGGNSADATIGGTVTGLAANASVILTDNGGDTLTVSGSASSIPFSFHTTIPSGDSYNVQVATQPTGQSCAVSYGSGVIDFAGDSINNVAVVCTNDAPIQVEVTGLASGSTVPMLLTLQNDPTGAVATIVSQNGVATSFVNSNGAPILLPLGTIYGVSVQKQPNPQVCTATSTPSGGVVNSNTILVTFNCS